MKISKKAEYGLRAMLYLAKTQPAFAKATVGKKDKKIKTIPLREIAKKEKIPFDFLEKIMGNLEKAGLIKAKKGAQGGYFLAKPANEITPGDIVMVLEENMTQTHCLGCPMAGCCTSEDVWSEVQQSLDSSLNAVSLADLIKKSK